MRKPDVGKSVAGKPDAKKMNHSAPNFAAALNKKTVLMRRTVFLFRDYRASIVSRQLHTADGFC